MIKEFLLNRSLKDIFLIISLIIVCFIISFLLISAYISFNISSLLDENIILTRLVNRFTRLNTGFKSLELNSNHFLHRQTYYDPISLRNDIEELKTELDDLASKIEGLGYMDKLNYIVLIKGQILDIEKIISETQDRTASHEEMKKIYDAFFLSSILLEELDKLFHEITQQNLNNLKRTNKLNTIYIIPLLFIIVFLPLMLLYQTKLIKKKVNDLKNYFLSFELGKSKQKGIYPSKDEFVDIIQTYTNIVYAAEEYIAEIKYLKSYLMNIIDSMPSILVSFDNKGRVTQVNRCFEEYMGIERERVIGMDFWSIDTPLKDFEKDCKKLLNSEEGSRIYKHQYFLKRYWDIYIFPMISGNIPGLVIRADDITEKEEIEQSLRRAQQMELLGTMAGGLAHDFNNSLSGIIGTLSILKYKIKNNLIKDVNSPDLNNYLNLMQNSADNSSRIVKHLLALSHQQETIAKNIDLVKIIDNVISVAGNTFEKRIVIKKTIEKENAIIKGDPSQIEQVVLNIAINAYHSMTIMKDKEEPGEILFILNKINADNDFCDRHPMAQIGYYWKLSIKDSGIGMDKDTQSRIWAPFFTTKKKENGVGLGLSMVYSIIKKHGGFIEVNSRINEGSIFDIYLPASVESLAKEEDIKEDAFYHGEGLILVIDDEASLRQIAKDMLESCGYEVILAKDGLEGIEKFKQYKDEISLIILDVIMPIKSGKEIYLELKNIKKDIKVIVVSGFRKDRRVDFLLEQGCISFVQKPFDFKTLTSAVHKAL